MLPALLPLTSPGSIRLAGAPPVGTAAERDVPSASVTPSTIHLTRLVRGIPQVDGCCSTVTPWGTYMTPPAAAAWYAALNAAVSSVTPFKAALYGGSLTLMTPAGPGFASTYCLVAACRASVGAD